QATNKGPSNTAGSGIRHRSRTLSKQRVTNRHLTASYTSNRTPATPQDVHLIVQLHRKPFFFTKSIVRPASILPPPFFLIQPKEALRLCGSGQRSSTLVTSESLI